MEYQNSYPIPLLFVEDEEAHIDLIEFAFEEYPGVFTLTFARSLEEAELFLDLRDFDLVIADYLLPDGKGLDLVFPDINTKNIPVIIMTSHGNEKVAVEVMKSNALDYFIKSDILFNDMPHLVTRALQHNEDILARKTAEVQVQSNTALLESIMDAVPDLLFVVDKDLRILYSNDKGHDRNPNQTYDPEDTCYNRFKDMKSSCEVCPAREVFQSGKSFEMEETDPLDGKTREVRAFPIRDGIGQVNRVVVHVRDISERKAAEHAIVASEEKYRQLVENISDILFTLDSKGIFTYIGPAVYRDLETQVQDIIGKSVFTFIRPEDTDTVQTAIEEGLTGKNIELELELLLNSGEIRYIHLSAQPILAQGVVTGFAGIISDISDKKNLDRLKIHALKKIDENLHVLATLNDEIRNPLSIILILADLLHTEDGGKIVEQVNIIDKLIDELDRGWVASDKVRNFLVKYYGVGQ